MFITRVYIDQYNTCKFPPAYLLEKPLFRSSSKKGKVEMISLSVIKSPLATYYLHILLIILLLKRKCFISEVDKMFPDGQGPTQHRMEQNLQPYPLILVIFKFPQQGFQEQDNVGVQQGHQQYFLLNTVPSSSVRK